MSHGREDAEKRVAARPPPFRFSTNDYENEFSRLVIWSSDHYEKPDAQRPDDEMTQSNDQMTK
jgi:hypothetical protein